jgi:hypothetical protein
MKKARLTQTGKPRKSNAGRNADVTNRINQQELEQYIVWAEKKAIADYFTVGETTIDTFIKRTYGTNFCGLRNKKRLPVKNMLVFKALELAQKGNITMLIFLLKTMCGFNEEKAKEIMQNGNGLSEFVKSMLIKKEGNGHPTSA